MKTKIVYALTSDTEDFFLEETMMSVFTARHYNPGAHITLVTDTFTMDTCCEGMRLDFINSFDEVVVVDTSAMETKAKRSRFIKTSLRNHIAGDYLFIDSDTAVCGDLSDIDSINADVAMVIDSHIPKAVQTDFLLPHEITRWGRDCDTDEYFNSGVMLVKDTPGARTLYDTWHNQWLEVQKSGVHLDQPPLHRAIALTGTRVFPLDGIWNCQIWGSFIPNLHEARIIHYSPKATGEKVSMLTDPMIPRQVRLDGGISDKTKNLLIHPKSAFYPGLTFIKDDQVSFARTDFYLDSLYLYKKHPRIFNHLDKIKKIFMRLAAHSCTNN